MKTASCRLVIAKNGSDYALTGVTPAEVLLLRSVRQNSLGRDPITELKPGPDVTRSATEEKKRLLSKYKASVVEKLFPGASPNLPEGFAVAAEVVVTEKLTTPPNK